MTKVATPVIQTLLDDSLIDFGTSHVTIVYDTKQWSLTANYTTLGDSLTDCDMYLGDNKINLTPCQLELIKHFLVKKLDDEQYSEAENKRRSMDCDNGSHLLDY